MGRPFDRRNTKCDLLPLSFDVTENAPMERSISPSKGPELASGGVDADEEDEDDDRHATRNAKTTSGRRGICGESRTFSRYLDGHVTLPSWVRSCRKSERSSAGNTAW